MRIILQLCDLTGILPIPIVHSARETLRPWLKMRADWPSRYLPKLPAGSDWIYWYNMSSVGSGGSRVSWSSPSIVEFPLFYIRDTWKYTDHPTATPHSDLGARQKMLQEQEMQ